MSSGIAKRPWHSLSFRLTIWYAGIFAVTSLVAFFLFYLLITTVIREGTDQELAGQAEQFSLVLRERGIEAVETFALLEAQAAGVKKVFFRLLYPNGEAFSSSSMSYWQDIAVHKEAVERLIAGQRRVYETVLLSARKDQVRVLYALIGPGVILQVGRSMESSSRIVAVFRGIFLTTMALLLGLATGVGWFMARRAVSGVEAVTRTARIVAGGSLEKRVPVKSRGDEIDQLAMTFNQMLDRIQTLVTELREMSDNIAHDLKNPITRIRGSAEVTLTTARTLPEYETMAASAIEECDRLLDMINTMLMISKTEGGVEMPAAEAIDLAALAREACELFGTTAEDREVKMTCTVPDSCPLQGDARMIRRLIANLLDNALKYTPPGGAVTVSVVESGQQALLAVRDTGMGIPAGDLPRIFERFYRGDQSRSQTGIGLGLSLARAIARAHRGEITVTSAPGAGSTFTVTLPKPGSQPAHKLL
ncbi:MAG: sensor histidine kinase [Syntrophales bacterium]